MKISPTMTTTIPATSRENVVNMEDLLSFWI